MNTVLLAAIVLCAATVQTAIGFGFMVVCVTLASLFLEPSTLFGILVPISLGQSTIIAVRERSFVLWPLLLVRVLPLMGIGMAISLAFIGQDASFLKPALGIGIFALAIKELLFSPQQTAPNRLAANLGIGVAGLVHGLFVTGGPPLVWAIGKEGIEKQAFRATLAVVWTSLNCVMALYLLAKGTINATTIQSSGMLVVALLAGLWLGNTLHGKVEEALFRKVVWSVLALASIPLMLSGFR